MGIESELKSISKDISQLGNLENAWQFLCRLSIIFQEKEISNNFDGIKSRIILSITEEVLTNDIFCNTTNEVLTAETDKFSENKEIKEKKRLIKLFLEISFFSYAIFLDQLDNSNIKLLRNSLWKVIRNLREKSNDQFTHENILMLFVEISREKKYQFNSKFPYEKINDKFLFENSIKALMLITATFSAMPYIRFIALSLKNRHEFEKSLNSIEVSQKLNHLYGASAKSIKTIKTIEKNYENKFNDDSLRNYMLKFRTQNEKITGFIIEKVTSGFKYEKGKRFSKKLQEKLPQIAKINFDIIRYCKNQLSAFREDEKGRNDEWANKIFLTTVELLSVLTAISKAKNIRWVSSVSIRYLSLWLKNIHEIINRNELMDDWDEINKYLKKEDLKVEWKSSFLTATEKILDEKSEKQTQHNLLQTIVKTIVGMMNSEGGNIIIGICENPEKIKRIGVVENSINRSGTTFYDINHELKYNKLDIDMIKRRIQDILSKQTKLSIDKLTKHWSLNSAEILDDKGENRARIFRIEVIKRTNEPVFFVKDENNSISVQLPKRVNARTVFEDPRKLLLKSTEKK